MDGVCALQQRPIGKARQCPWRRGKPSYRPSPCSKWSAQHTTSQPSFHVLNVCVCGQCLAHSEYNFHAKFLSLLIYSHLGLGAAAQSFIVKLDFKNAQYEALGYTLFDTYLDSAMM